MIQVNLIYPNGVKYTTQTYSVQDLIQALQLCPNPTVTAVLLHDPDKKGVLPIKSDGIFIDPDVSARYFRLSQVVDVS